MTNVPWINPSAPELGRGAAPLAVVRSGARATGSGAFTVALLDNTKANAEALLGMLAERVKAELPLATIKRWRKQGPANGAPSDMLDEIAAEADFFLTAMGD
jgi:hypothetical protein